MTDTKTMHCPCGNDKQYINCCGRYLDNAEAAATAEILMRSRYTAYTLEREDYLLATWHRSTRNLTWIGKPAAQSMAGAYSEALRTISSESCDC